MKKLKIILSLCAILFLASCSKDNNNEEQVLNIDLTSTKWEVVKIRKQGELDYLNADRSYTLEFNNDGTYNMGLFSNSCTGNYNISDSESISISNLGCTSIAGDSDFAWNFSDLFHASNKYYGEGNEIIFEGQGKIVVKPF